MAQSPAIIKTRRAEWYETSFGLAGAGLEGDKVARFWLPGLSEKKLLDEMAQWADGNVHTATSALGLCVKSYFDGETVEFNDSVDIDGLSGFAQKVLSELRNVRWGKTVTYAKLARMAGAPGSARAIGAVMAKNPVPLVIPCHRVLRSDGRVGGFSGPGGDVLKKRMLALEGVITP